MVYDRRWILDVYVGVGYDNTARERKPSRKPKLQYVYVCVRVCIECETLANVAKFEPDQVRTINIKLNIFS